MQFLYLLLFGLSVQFGFSQTYSFALLTKYDSDYGDHQHETIVYSNPEFPAYYMFVTRYQNGTFATLADFSAKMTHRFKTTETIAASGETLFSFEYEESLPFASGKKKKCNGVFLTTKTELDSTSGKVEIVQFKDKKRKKVLGAATLQVKNSAKNYLPIFLYSCWHGINPEDLGLAEFRGIVESAEFNYGNSVSTSKLSYFKELSFALTLPRELKFPPKAKMRSNWMYN